MDRNAPSGVDFAEDWLVALRKESVDRNIIYLLTASALRMSLSARRAWIEILQYNALKYFLEVALRKESVDRNDTMQIVVVIVYAVALRKESVDRNDTMQVVIIVVHTVALRKESVDRNFVFLLLAVFVIGRSPQGERG